MNKQTTICGVSLSPTRVLGVRRDRLDGSRTYRYIWANRRPVNDQHSNSSRLAALRHSIIQIQACWRQLGGVGSIVLALPPPWVHCWGLSFDRQGRWWHLRQYIRINRVRWATYIGCTPCDLYCRTWRLSGYGLRYVIALASRYQLLSWYRYCHKLKLPLRAIDSQILSVWRARYHFKRLVGVATDEHQVDGETPAWCETLFNMTPWVSHRQTIQPVATQLETAIYAALGAVWWKQH